MLYFSKLRILFISLFSVFFILIALSNLLTTDKSFFNKKINLGLDLQGGSYLLLEIDNDPVIEQKLQNLTITIRNYFKERNIKTTSFKLKGLILSLPRLRIFGSLVPTSSTLLLTISIADS